ncbi:MAG: M13-type metalloendopeptidase [Pseudomonadota bacterium]
MKRHLLSTLTLSLMAAFATAAPLSGIETQTFDANVRVQDDVFAHMHGKWLQTTEIPAERSSWGPSSMLAETVKTQVRSIIETAQKDKARKAGSNAQKIGDLYDSFMDEKKLEALGHKALAGELAKVRGMKDKNGVPAMAAHLAKLGVETPHTAVVLQDLRDSTRYAAYIDQSGIGLPDRDYYLKKDDAKMVEVLAKYEKHVARMLELAGHKDAAAAAKSVLAFETEIAQVQWTKVELRDVVKQYNKLDMAKLNALTPGYNWSAWMAETGLAKKVDYVIAAQPSFLIGYTKALEKTDLASIKAYFEWQLVRSYAPYLSKPFVDADFAFYGTALSGKTENLPRWKRGVDTVEGALGEAIGKQYVALHFPAERKVRMEALVGNLLAAFGQSIDSLDWMGPATKKEAQGKLATFMPKIGYPNKWVDYSAMTIKRGDLVGNVQRAREFSYMKSLNRLGKPIDRDAWEMTPQTINAYYNPLLNEIVFPASILQAPYFDMRADDAVNYGGIGAVIGHEISHGFDDQGSEFDAKGNMREWWTPEDRARFKAKTDVLVKQYGAYAPLPGYNVNGALTLGENIGDNSGLAIAYKAYQLSLKGKPAPVIDGLTGDQRFFMGWVQVWRVKMREQEQIKRVKTDPHSPGMFRANGTLMNQPGFYSAFGIKEGDKMYLPPADRVTIW